MVMFHSYVKLPEGTTSWQSLIFSLWYSKDSYGKWMQMTYESRWFSYDPWPFSIFPNWNSSPEGRKFLSFSSKKSGLMWLPYPSSRQVLGSQLEKKPTKFCHKNGVAISSNTRKKKGVTVDSLLCKNDWSVSCLTLRTSASQVVLRPSNSFTVSENRVCNIL